MNELIIIVISVILISRVSLIPQTDITHYPNVTLSECGISRESLLMSGQCFQWYSNTSVDIHLGRNVEPYEVPWIALFRIPYGYEIYTDRTHKILLLSYIKLYFKFIII